MLERIERIRLRLKKEGLDAFAAMDGVNRNYLSGFTGSAGLLLVTLKKAYFITDSRYQTQVKQQVKGCEIVIQTLALGKEAVVLIRKIGLKKVGFEAGLMPVAEYEWFKSRLKRVVLTPTLNWVEELRMKKDAGEISRIRQAARITDKAFRHILPYIRVGVKERDLAAEIEFYMKRQGAAGVSFETIVASGPRGAMPHGISSAKPLARGELVVMDFGCMFEGYASDMTRTVALGDPGPKARRVYRAVLQAQNAGLKALKPGLRCLEVDKKARSVLARKGYGRYFGHGLGHGVGMDVHEDPRLSPGVKIRLEPGMVVTVEPGVYIPGEFGVRIEDLAVVTKEGCEVLSRSRKDLLVL
jgi:Xaa-Pro aminopeptidase